MAMLADVLNVPTVCPTATAISWHLETSLSQQLVSRVVIAVQQQPLEALIEFTFSSGLFEQH